MLRRFRSASFLIPSLQTTLFRLNSSTTTTTTNNTNNNSNNNNTLSEKQNEFLQNFRSKLSESKNSNPEEFVQEAATAAATISPCGIPNIIPLREDGPTSVSQQQQQQQKSEEDENNNNNFPKVPHVKRGVEPLPKWLRLKKPEGALAQARYNKLLKQMNKNKLATVCQEAKCPNIGECWGGGAATDEDKFFSTSDNTSSSSSSSSSVDGGDQFHNHESTPTLTIMIMGDTCTRACRFCAVKTARIPPPLDVLEPEKTALAVNEMGVPYIVITMVDRDDLPDSGADHVAKTIQACKEKSPSLLLECLVGDFQGNEKHIEKVVRSGLDVYAHNIECVERITGRVRDRRAGYQQSLKTLEYAKQLILSPPSDETISSSSAGSNNIINKNILTKTSVMLGLGETTEEIRQTLRDCKNAGIDAITFGQYLQPSKTRMKVERYVHPTEFKMWKKEADDLGFVYCASGPMVRSSYRAGEFYMSNVIRARKLKDKQEAQLQQQEQKTA